MQDEAWGPLAPTHGATGEHRWVPESNGILGSNPRRPRAWRAREMVSPTAPQAADRQPDGSYGPERIGAAFDPHLRRALGAGFQHVVVNGPLGHSIRRRFSVPLNLDEAQCLLPRRYATTTAFFPTELGNVAACPRLEWRKKNKTKPLSDDIAGCLLETNRKDRGNR